MNASTARVYYLYSLNNNGGVTSVISAHLNSISGCTSSVAQLSTKNSLESAFNTYNIVYVRTHAGGGILQCTDGNLLANDVLSNSHDYDNLKLAYLSGCSSSTTSENGCFPSTLISKGAKSVIGFSQTISWYTETTEVNYLDERVFFYLANGNDVVTSVFQGMTNAINVYGRQFGIPSINYSGSYITL